MSNISKRRKWPNYHAYVVYESNTDNLLTCPPPPLGFSLWLSYEASNLKTIIQMIAACLLWLWLLLPAHDFPHHPRISDIKMWAAIWRPSKVPQAKSLSVILQQPVNCTIRQSKTHPRHTNERFLPKISFAPSLLPGYYCSLASKLLLSWKVFLIKSVSDSWWFVTYYQKHAYTL